MTFPSISTVNATNDVSELLVYANQITGYWFIPLVLIAFFVIVLAGSYYGLKRTTGRGYVESCFAVAGFATFGMTVIMASKNGLVTVPMMLISLAIAIIGLIWVAFAED